MMAAEFELSVEAWDPGSSPYQLLSMDEEQRA